MMQLLGRAAVGRVGWAVVSTGMALRCPPSWPRAPTGRRRSSTPTSATRPTPCCGTPRATPRDGQWAEAVEIYQRVIQQFGDKVAKLPKDDPAGDPTGDSVLFVDLRQFCQRRLAALPPEARAIYRARVDAQAERWFRQGAASRDRSSLRRVVEQAFCSSWGDDALELLGDLAFQDGRFDEALALYRQLVPDRPGDRPGPGPSRPERRPGAGRRQEAPLPRGARRRPAGPGRPGRVRRRVPERAGVAGRPERALAEDLGRGPRLRPPRPPAAARRPLADVRRLADPDARSCRRADRRRLAPVAGRARAVEASEPRHPDGRGMGVRRWRRRRRSPPTGSLAYHPIVLGRPGPRLRREPGSSPTT